MAVVARVIGAPPDAVAAVLADPRSYDGVVVGSKRIRWFDARWPEPGTHFHHSVGFGILHIRDRTAVVRDELPSRLVLAAGMGFPEVRPRSTSPSPRPTVGPGSRCGKSRCRGR